MDWKQELLKRLDSLGAKMATAGATMWAWAVKQAVIDGWECVIGTLVLWVGAGILFHIGIRFNRTVRNWDGPHILLPISAVVLLGLSAIPLFNAIDLLSNPEYWALHNLLRSIQ